MRGLVVRTRWTCSFCQCSALHPWLGLSHVAVVIAGRWCWARQQSQPFAPWLWLCHVLQLGVCCRAALSGITWACSWWLGLGVGNISRDCACSFCVCWNICGLTGDQLLQPPGTGGCQVPLDLLCMFWVGRSWAPSIFLHIFFASALYWVLWTGPYNIESFFWMNWSPPAGSHPQLLLWGSLLGAGHCTLVTLGEKKSVCSRRSVLLQPFNNGKCFRLDLANTGFPIMKTWDLTLGKAGDSSLAVEQ